MVDSEPSEEDEMFSLAAGFTTRMHKLPATLEDEATSSSGEKRPRRSPSNEGAQKDWAIISVESPDIASNDQSALGVCLNETDTPLEEGVPIASPSNVEEVGTGALSGAITTPAPSPKSINSEPSGKQVPDQVVVRAYVPPLERVPPSMDTVALDLEDILKLIRR